MRPDLTEAKRPRTKREASLGSTGSNLFVDIMSHGFHVLYQCGEGRPAAIKARPPPPGQLLASEFFSCCICKHKKPRTRKSFPPPPPC